MRDENCDSVAERARRLVRITGCCPRCAQLRAEDEAKHERELRRARELFVANVLEPIAEEFVRRHFPNADTILDGMVLRCATPDEKMFECVRRVTKEITDENNDDRNE